MSIKKGNKQKDQPPGINATAHGKYKGMGTSTGDLLNGAALQRGDDERRVSEDEGAIAKLPGRVLSPGPDLAILAQGKAVPHTTGDLDNPLI